MADSLPRVFGPYELLARLGQGAAGAAYLARPLDALRGVPSPVVIKCMHPQLLREEEFVRRFRHEAEIAVRIDGRNVARTFDVGSVGDALYIALEYIPGWTFGKLLSTHVAAARVPPIDVACGLAVDAARGLHSIHTAADKNGRPLEAVHRDVSPKNVMLGDDGVVRIIDLGLGKSNVQDWKTGAGRVMGSPGYMPVEQCRGSDVDRRADIYAVGVILHEMLTGVRYIPLTSSVTMLVAALEKRFVAPSSIRRDVPPNLDEVLRIAMARRVEDRMVDAASLADAIERAAPVAAEDRLARWSVSLLSDAHRKRIDEVGRLMALPVPADFERDIEKTVVFVRRDGVGSVPASAASVLPPTKVLGTDELVAADSAAMASVPASLFSVPGQSRWPQLTIVGLALLIGFGAGAWLTSSRDEPAQIEVPAAPARVAEPVRATARPVDLPRTREPPAGSTPRKRLKTSLRAARRAAPVVSDMVPASSSALARTSERVKALENRALALKATSRTEAVKLLGRLSMIRAAGASERVSSQLDQIDAALRRLEESRGRADKIAAPP